MNKPNLMLALFSLLLAGLLLVAGASSEVSATPPPVQWEKMYGLHEGRAVTQTVDGGYAIMAVAGEYNYRPSMGSYWSEQPVLIKTDSNGEVQFRKNLANDTEIGFVHSITQTNDSGYLILHSYGVVKTDGQGDIQWTVMLESYTDLIHTRDGGYVFARGHVIPPTTTVGEINVAELSKVDEKGKVLWNKTFEAFSPRGWSYVYPCSIVEANDGGYVLAGSWNGWPWCYKADSEGNMLWNRTLNLGLYTYRVTKIVQTDDAGYAATYTESDPNHGLVWGCGLFKIDYEGYLQWHQVYENVGAFSSLIQTKDRGYLMGGSYGAWVAKADSSGKFLWNVTYANNSTRVQGTVSEVIGTRDGAYAVVGTLNENIWLVKFASEFTESPESPANSQFVVAAVVAIVVVIVVTSLTVYLKRRKH